MSDGMDMTRSLWEKESPKWPAQIEHAAKRRRLGLSLRMPVGTRKDGYLRFMNDEERSWYLAACEQLEQARDERTLILSKTPNGNDTEIIDGEDKRRYDMAGLICDEALDTIWPLRQLIVDRTREDSLRVPR